MTRVRLIHLAIVLATWHLVLCSAVAVPKFDSATQLDPPGSIEMESPTVDSVPKLVVGESAPVLKVEKWLKGGPIESFAKNHVYVVEFWATWCASCVQSIPHLSALQDKYKDRVTVIGISTDTKRSGEDSAFVRVADFVRNRGHQLRYVVAYDGESRAAQSAWMDSAEVTGIPKAFVVAGDGTITYIGHPASDEMDAVIGALLDGTFDRGAAELKYKEQLTRKRDFSRAERLLLQGKVEEADMIFDRLSKQSPKSARAVAFRRFGLFLQTKRYDQAWAIGPALVQVHCSDNTEYLFTIASEILDLPAADQCGGLDIARSAALRAVEIDTSQSPAVPSLLARAYWAQGDRVKAIEWARKAVANASSSSKKRYEAQLEKYLAKE